MNKLGKIIITEASDIAKTISRIPGDPDSESQAYQNIKRTMAKKYLLEPLELADSRAYAEYFSHLAGQDIKSGSLNEAQGELEASQEALGSNSLYVAPSSYDCTADPEEDELAHLSDLNQWINDTIQMVKYQQQAKN